MEENPGERETADKILRSIEEAYGFIPLVNRVLSQRPDLFVPAAGYTRAVLEGRGDLDRKTRYLAALSAAAALGSEHCLRVQMEHAIEAGATKDEILETLTIGSMMAMTRSQSYAFRAFDERFPKE